jgi:peptidoglycan/LPS O-acetylase OafA/YrhL
MAEREALGRLPALDGIRAAAAIMVLGFHFVGHHGESPWLVQAFGIGQTGVDLFFVLSGFLITRILLSTKTSPHFFRSFYARRTLRIFPLYFGYLALYFFLVPPLLGDPIPPLETQLWSWFYLENVPQTFLNLRTSGPGHFWSLAVEEQFYLVWPLLVFSLSRRQFGAAVLATLLLPPIIREVFLHYGLRVFFFTLTRVDALGYGAGLAVLMSRESFRPARWIRVFRWLLIALPLLLLPAFMVFSGSRLMWLQAVKLSLIPAFYCALVGFCLIDPAARPLTRLFSLAWLRWLGAISYGLYVFHPTCFVLVQRLVAPRGVFLDAVLSLGLTVAVAYLSFRFFESPILRLKKYFLYDVKGPVGGGEAGVESQFRAA